MRKFNKKFKPRQLKRKVHVKKLTFREILKKKISHKKRITAINRTVLLKRTAINEVLIHIDPHNINNFGENLIVRKNISNLIDLAAEWKKLSPELKQVFFTIMSEEFTEPSLEELLDEPLEKDAS